jgi:hypothetical protein
MSAEQVYWRDFVLVVGGVALVALLQVSITHPEASLRVWMLHGLFGALYALIGSATTFMAVTRPRGPKKSRGHQK